MAGPCQVLIDDLNVSARSPHYCPPRRAAYGRLSVLTRWLADAEILFDAGISLWPPPKITSSIVQIVPLTHPRYPCSQNALELSHAQHLARRKMLRSSLKKINEELLAEAGIEPDLSTDIDIEYFVN